MVETMIAIANRHRELAEQQREDQAVRIANAVGRVFGD